MSTKIHNGYRLADGTNPFEFIRRVRAVMDPIRDEADAELIAKKSTQAADLRWLRREQVGPALLLPTPSAAPGRTSRAGSSRKAKQWTRTR